jgi:hypothetical protein
MPQPSCEALTVFLDRQFESWPEPSGIEAKTLAIGLGHVSFAEALEFCHTVRRQHILSLDNRALRDILKEQLNLWSARVAPEEADADATRSGEASPPPERAKRRRQAPLGRRRNTSTDV